MTTDPTDAAEPAAATAATTAASDADGAVVADDGERRLRFERLYPFPVAEVWDAITDRERLGRWLFPTTFEPRAGGGLEVDMGDYGTASGRVLVWSEPNHLEYEWGQPSTISGSDETWRIRFLLSDAGSAGTRLVFEHVLPEPSRPEFAAGWHWYLARLALHLGGGVPAAVETDEDFDRLLAHYGGVGDA